MAHYGVDVSLIGYVAKEEIATGQAMIQLSEGDKENAIVLNGGANLAIDATLIHTWLSEATSSDLLLIQNEISGNEYALQRARDIGILKSFFFFFCGFASID